MRRFLVALVLVSSLTAVGRPAVAAAPEMTIDPVGKVVAGGAAVVIEVTSSCTSGEDVLEAFVYVTQDGRQSSFGPVRASCDGLSHTDRVRVRATDFRFHRGAAHGSGYFLTSSGQSVSPSQELHLR